LVEILVEAVYKKKKKLPENFQYIAKKNVEKSGLLQFTPLSAFCKLLVIVEVKVTMW
jgi:hypothetical protein